MSNTENNANAAREKGHKVKKSGRGYSKAENLAAKASKTLRQEMVSFITGIIAKNEWRQKDASQHLGITQPRVSNLNKGQVDKFSVDKLADVIQRAKVTLKLRYRFASNQDFTVINESEIPLKDQCVQIIKALIEHKGWKTQDEVKKNFSISQPRVSNLINGLTKKFSMEFILGILSGQGLNVTVVSESESLYYISIDVAEPETDKVSKVA